MNPIASLHATPKAWLVNSALAPHLDAFAAYLKGGRYAANTTKGYVAGIAHFARWMTQCCLPVQLLDEHTVEQFLGNHLPRCAIALWLGHENPTTMHHYVEADLAMKDRALARLQEPDTKIRRYRAPDSLLEFLKTL